MCGICGFNWEDKELLREMTAVLKHRGPDGGGLFTDQNFSFGHRRLSIIDLSSAGKQPMANEDNSIFIVYNGEIYNFKELRAELEQHHHQFRSHTDTEVIIHGYEQWGEEVVHKLNGMFAFCLYDQNKKKLFLARDRLGIKPVYYYQNQNKFIFASELKAILLAGIPRQVDLQAARNYLNLRYIPGENTLFQGIKKLLPGHTLTYQNQKIIIRQFWDLPLPQITGIPPKTAAEKVKELLTDSVKRRLIADVPVGLYLSGGIDSAALTALASQIKEEKEEGPVKTFSVGFDYDDEVDELHQAKAVAEHFNTDHHEITLSQNISSLLPQLIWHLDQPHGDPVIIPQFYLSRLASRKVKVILSGEGADELFAGYVQYKTFLQAQKTKLIPSAIKSAVAQKTPVRLLDKFFDYPSSLGEKGKEKAVDFIKDLKNKEESYQDLISIMSKKDKDLLFTDRLKQSWVGGGEWTVGNNPENRPNPPNFQPERKPLLNQLLYYDTKTWLPDYVLFINDRMTMAHSIEGRVPFLDHRLAEYAATLPARLKLNGNITKYILRKTLKDILPNPEIKKHAFFMPLDKWHQEELKPLAEQLFTHQKVKRRGYFNYYYLKRIWENYSQSKLLYGKQLFTLLSFELWLKMFIDNEKIPKDGNIKLGSLL